MLKTSNYYAVTKSFIIDDLRRRDPPLVCLFPVKSITKKINIYNEIDVYMFKVKKKNT